MIATCTKGMGRGPGLAGAILALLCALPWALMAQDPAAITCLGRLVPGEKLMRVSAPEGAIVADLQTRRGESVAAGAALATLRGFAAARAAVAAAEQQVAVAAAELALVRAGRHTNEVAAQAALRDRQQAVCVRAAKERRRHEDLSRQRLISDSRFDELQSLVAAEEAALQREEAYLNFMKTVRPEEVAVAAARLASAQAHLEQAQAEAELQILRAPLAGRVLAIHAWPGEAIGRDGLLELGDTDNLFAEAEVYVTDAPRLKTGAAASMTGESFTGTLHGVVSEVIPLVGDSAVYPADPTAFADRRIVIARIALQDAGRVRTFVNSRLFISIAP